MENKLVLREISAMSIALRNSVFMDSTLTGVALNDVIQQSKDKCHSYCAERYIGDTDL